MHDHSSSACGEILSATMSLRWLVQLQALIDNFEPHRRGSWANHVDFSGGGV
jgi:hypothetical protein